MGWTLKSAIFVSHRVFLILNALVLLGACSAPNPAPVHDRGTIINDRLSHHYVSKGETLYSIAWRYGLGYRELASWNRIGQPYTIYPGQRLRLKPGPKTIKPKPVAVAKPSKPAETRSKTSTVKTKPVQPKPASPKSLKWRWPVDGALVGRYSAGDSLNKGIDIAAALGKPVVAAAPGVVVYAGSGLRGYGNLLIIKHNDRFLSAYAHNRRLLVKEQSKVKAGQKIAEVGASGTNKNKLHFEIRRDGKPVDPLRYLPKR